MLQNFEGDYNPQEMRLSGLFVRAFHGNDSLINAQHRSFPSFLFFNGSYFGYETFWF
jgi:hypothetical protein